MSRKNTKNTAETAENNDSLDARERAALEQAELAMQQLEDNNGYGDGDGSVRDFGTLLNSLRQYKKAAYLTPVLVAIEALFEVLIPTFMAFLIDQGLNKHDISKVWQWGLVLLVIALCSLAAGIGAGRYAAQAATGLSRNLRHDLFKKVQDFSFTNIDRFS